MPANSEGCNENLATDRLRDLTIDADVVALAEAFFEFSKAADELETDPGVFFFFVCKRNSNKTQATKWHRW